MKHSEETKKKISETLKRKGIKPSVLPTKEQCLINLGALAKKGSTAWNKGKRGVQVAWNKGIEYTQIKGAKNPRWRGGISSENMKVRKSLAIKQWRTSVFDRDDYTCQSCGKRGGNLEADHVMPFSLFPELRTEVLNGRTLCRPCHKKTFLTKVMQEQLTATTAPKGLMVVLEFRLP